MYIVCSAEQHNAAIYCSIYLVNKCVFTFKFVCIEQELNYTSIAFITRCGTEWLKIEFLNTLYTGGQNVWVDRPFYSKMAPGEVGV